MGHQFGSSGLATEGHNKEFGEIRYYEFGTQIQSRPNIHGKTIVV